MAVEMEGLEFQIETKADESAKGIDALVKSFEKLKGITKGGLGLGSSVKQLEKLDGVLKKFDTSKLEGLGKALESVSKLGEVKISGSVAKQLGGIADVMDRITLADIERLEDMAKALRDLGKSVMSKSRRSESRLLVRQWTLLHPLRVQQTAV